VRVTVKRTGGFANIARVFTIDSSDLNEADVAELENAVEALLDATADKHPDGFRYRITVDSESYEISECWITRTLLRLAER
jgi:hypothetical protein